MVRFGVGGAHVADADHQNPHVAHAPLPAGMLGVCRRIIACPPGTGNRPSGTRRSSGERRSMAPTGLGSFGFQGGLVCITCGRLGFVRILLQLRCVRIRVRLGFVRIPGRSGFGTFDPVWVRSDARELRVRLGQAVPTTPPTGAGGVDDRLGNSARRHASARSGLEPLRADRRLHGHMKGNARAGDCRSAWASPDWWGMGPNPFPSGGGAPTPLRPRNPTPDSAGSLPAGGGGRLGKRRGSLRRGPAFYPIVGI